MVKCLGGWCKNRKPIPCLLSICQLDFLLFEVIDKFHPTLHPPSCPLSSLHLSSLQPLLLSAWFLWSRWHSTICLCPFPYRQQSDQVEHGLNSPGFSYSFAACYSLDLVLFGMSWISRDKLWSVRVSDIYWYYDSLLISIYNEKKSFKEWA